MSSYHPHVATAALLARLPLDALFSSLKQDSMSPFNALLTHVIMQLDEAISDQLSAVIQHPYFKALESRWKGVNLLTSLPVSSRRVKIKMLDWRWAMLCNDLKYSFDVRQCVLYKKLYANEFDTAGGTPFGLVFIDHKVASDYSDEVDVDDLYTLQLLSELGEMALCPMVLGVDELFFGDDPRRLFHDARRAKRILDSKDFASWTQLREKVSSRFLHLVLPEFLLRSPYQHYAAGFVFNESQAPQNALWGNSGYLFSANVIREFERISWFGFLKSYDASGAYGAIVQASTPIVSRIDLPSEDDGFWAEQGFIPLSSLYLSGQKGFFSNQSVWNVPNGVSPQLGMLQTNLMACRFAHYTKMQIRDLVGRYDSVQDCQKRLDSWLRQYVSNNDFAEDGILARYPLRECQVRIQKSGQDETRYQCEIMLRPQYQCDFMDVEVQLKSAISYQDRKRS